MSKVAPLRCADAEPYLSALADGEVPEPLRSAVAAHAATCQHCGETLARHRIINDMIAGLPDSVPSPAVLDRVLAARAPRVLEPVQRESLRRRTRARAATPRRLPAFLTAPQIEPAPLPALPRRRSFWQATALPTLAAVLLISLTLLAFHRLPLGGGGVPPAQTATPHLKGDPYAQAQAAVAAAVQAHLLSFAPVVPWALPPGATFLRAPVDPRTHALDIIWTLNGSFAQLHVREAPVALATWGDYRPSAASQSLVWQLPGKSAWRAVASVQNSAVLAVAQDDGTYSIAVDVSFAGEVDAGTVTDTTRTQAVNVLRLASLSMDSARQQSPALVAPDTQSSVIHYVAQSGTSTNLITRDVYVDLTHNHARVTVKDASGAVLYDDFIQGTTDTRYDPRHHVYGHPTASPTALAGAQLDASATNFFTFVNSYVADGELWYLGKTSWGSHSSVYQFTLTTAPYLTYVYADAISGRILGAEVRYNTRENAGASSAVSPLSPAGACLSYSLIEFQAPLPPGTFTPPQQYAAGTPPPSTTCPA